MRSRSNEAVPGNPDGRWQVRVMLLLVLLLGFALRLYELDGKALWYDELGTALYTSVDKSSLEVVRGPLEVPVIPAPPLSFLSTYALRMVSESDFVLRLPSVFFGVLAIAAVYVLGRELLGPRQGLVAAFLLSISAFHIRYSQEARYYALLMLLGTLSLYFFWRGLHRNDRWSWVGYAVVSTLAVYTHLFAFLFLAVQGVYALSSFLYIRLRARSAAWARSWKQDPFFSFLASASFISSKSGSASDLLMDAIFSASVASSSLHDSSRSFATTACASSLSFASSKPRISSIRRSTWRESMKRSISSSCASLFSAILMTSVWL